MSRKAILCVDDEPMILKSLKGQLVRHFGSQYLYEVAQSADEALDVIDELEERGADIVLIVSDWLMPNIKGDDFLIQVHQHHPHIVKIMLTGQASPEAVERAITEANLYCCLTKPWEEDVLIQTLQQALESNRD